MSTSSVAPDTYKSQFLLLKLSSNTFVESLIRIGLQLAIVFACIEIKHVSLGHSKILFERGQNSL